jgi:hypothetical protein
VTSGFAYVTTLTAVQCIPAQFTCSLKNLQCCLASFDVV